MALLSKRSIFCGLVFWFLTAVAPLAHTYHLKSSCGSLAVEVIGPKSSTFARAVDDPAVRSVIEDLAKVKPADSLTEPVLEQSSRKIEAVQEAWINRYIKNSCIKRGGHLPGAVNQAYGRIVRRGLAMNVALSLLALNAGYASSTDANRDYPFDLMATILVGSVIRAEVACRNEDPARRDLMLPGLSRELGSLNPSFWQRYYSYLKWMPITGGMYIFFIGTEDFIRGGVAEFHGDPDGLRLDRVDEKAREYAKELAAGMVWDLVFIGVHAKFLDRFFLEQNAKKSWAYSVPNMSERVNNWVGRQMVKTGSSVDAKILFIPARELAGEGVNMSWRMLNLYLRKWGFMEYRSLVQD